MYGGNGLLLRDLARPVRLEVARKRHRRPWQASWFPSARFRHERAECDGARLP